MSNINKYIKILLHPADGQQENHKAHQVYSKHVHNRDLIESLCFNMIRGNDLDIELIEHIRSDKFTASFIKRDHIIDSNFRNPIYSHFHCTSMVSHTSPAVLFLLYIWIIFIFII